FALGVFWAISRVGISGVLLLSGKLKERLTLKNFIVIQACLYTILFLGIGLTHNRWVIIVLFMLLSVIRWGSSSLRDHYYLEFIENLPNKASLLSINSFFEKIMTGIIGLMMGYSVLHFGYQMSYVITGVLFVVLVLLGYLILKNKKTEKSVL
ncbi:hypothetical protein KC901_01185, partial [Patescibacteria group bacterium]|nr:hypothetical protein [Patescibacteria group bacterium]